MRSNGKDSTIRTTIYSPEPALRRPGQVAREMWRELLAGRELAWQLALRDIRAQYRQTALGYLWVFILPAANTAVWIFMQKAGVVSVREVGMSYAVFVLTGTILWSIFMDAVNAPLQQATVAKPMLAKINFPREALIVAGIYKSAFVAAIRFVVLLIALLILGRTLEWTVLLAPIALLMLILAGTTLGVILTPIGLLYTDVGRSMPLLLQFLMFLSPVVYPAPQNGLAASLLAWNPLTPLINTGRMLVIGYIPDTIVLALLIALGTCVILFLAWIAYRIAMPILIERMSA